MAKDEPLAAAAEFAVLVLVAVITRHPPRWCARGAAGPGPARTCCRVCRVEDGQLNVIEVGQRTARRAGCRRRLPGRCSRGRRRRSWVVVGRRAADHLGDQRRRVYVGYGIVVTLHVVVRPGGGVGLRRPTERPDRLTGGPSGSRSGVKPGLTLFGRA